LTTTPARFQRLDVSAFPRIQLSESLEEPVLLVPSRLFSERFFAAARAQSRDSLAAFLSTVVQSQLWEYHSKSNLNRRWRDAAVSHSRFERFIRHGTIPGVFKTLEEFGLVVRTKEHIPQRASARYWISPDVLKDGAKTYSPKSQAMLRKLEENRRNPRLSVKTETDTLRSLFSNLKRVEIDTTAAKRTVQGLDFFQQAQAIQSTAAFASGSLYFVEDDFGRIHTPLTSVPKVLRKTLSVDGSSLASVDLKNSQPLLLAACASTENTTANSRDFLQLAESGSLYESIAGDCGFSDREESKSAFLRYVFSRLDRMSNPAGVVSGWMESRFPDVSAYCRTVKRNGHKWLAHTLQKAERQVIIDSAARRFAQTHQSAFCGTIHDSLMSSRPIRKSPLKRF
jgi:hypothetical protein